jgi:hypothetical protein
VLTARSHGETNPSHRRSGYKCKANRDGTWREGWEARHDLVKRGYRLSWVRLYYPDTIDGRSQLSARCKDLQSQMLAMGGPTRMLIANRL